MKSYVQQLNLSFDPFEASTASREFFEGGNRSQILDQIVERAMYSESLISVSGCLGSGKTSLLRAISQSFGEEAVVVNIVATLFMNPDQFMDELVGALQLPGEFESVEDSAHAVTRLAGQLHMDARSLLIQVDDAHELSSEVLKHLVALTTDTAADSVHVILFGESQLGNVLENTLGSGQLANLAEFELDGFGSEATIDYVRFKLAGAGYTKPLPLAGEILGSIHNSSNGLPGAINAMVRDALDEEFAVDDEAADVETADIETAGIELGALQRKFSADVAIEESDYTGDELEEFSAAREVEVPDTTDDGVEAASVSKRYFAAAAILLVVLIAAIALFRPNQEVATEVARISVPVSGPLIVSRTAAAPTSQAIPEEVSLSAIAQRPRASASVGLDVAASDSEQETVSTESIAAVEEAAEEVAKEITQEITQGIAQELVTIEPAIAVINADPVSESNSVSVAPSEAPSAASNSVNNSVSGTVVRTPDSVVSNLAIESSPDSAVEPASNSTAVSLSSFERTLLSYPSSSYTVQIVGASSETNIEAFVKAMQLSVTVGYFETRLNDKPWYVVIAGNFPDRESATALISSLPDSAKASGPWVRGLADIQADIQKLQ